MSNNHLAAPGPELAALYAQMPPSGKTYTADGMEAVRNTWFNIFMPMKQGLERQFLPSGHYFSTSFIRL